MGRAATTVHSACSAEVLKIGDELLIIGGCVGDRKYTNTIERLACDVVELTPNNFASKVMNSDDVWLVEFYAPRCGHCQSLAPG